MQKFRTYQVSTSTDVGLSFLVTNNYVFFIMCEQYCLSSSDSKFC
jgi:hypothetical protein